MSCCVTGLRCSALTRVLSLCAALAAFAVGQGRLPAGGAGASLAEHGGLKERGVGQGRGFKVLGGWAHLWGLVA